MDDKFAERLKARLMRDDVAGVRNQANFDAWLALARHQNPSMHPDGLKRKIELTGSLDEWIDDCFTIDPSAKTEAGLLPLSYFAWCQRNSVHVDKTGRDIVNYMSMRFLRRRANTGIFYHGLSLRLLA